MGVCTVEFVVVLLVTFLNHVIIRAEENCGHGGVLKYVFLEGEKDNYTTVDGVKTMNECVTKCCENRKCDLALFKNNRCYTVNCEHEDSCQIIHSADSKAQITFITSRPAKTKVNLPQLPSKAAVGNHENGSKYPSISPTGSIINQPGRADSNIISLNQNKDKNSRKNKKIVKLDNSQKQYPFTFNNAENYKSNYPQPMITTSSNQVGLTQRTNFQQNKLNNGQSAISSPTSWAPSNQQAGVGYEQISRISYANKALPVQPNTDLEDQISGDDDGSTTDENEDSNEPENYPTTGNLMTMTSPSISQTQTTSSQSQWQPQNIPHQPVVGTYNILQTVQERNPFKEQQGKNTYSNTLDNKQQRNPPSIPQQTYQPGYQNPYHPSIWYSNTTMSNTNSNKMSYEQNVSGDINEDSGQETSGELNDTSTDDNEDDKEERGQIQGENDEDSQASVNEGTSTQSQKKEQQSSESNYDFMQSENHMDHDKNKQQNSQNSYQTEALNKPKSWSAKEKKKQVERNSKINNQSIPASSKLIKVIEMPIQTNKQEIEDGLEETDIEVSSSKTNSNIIPPTSISNTMQSSPMISAPRPIRKQGSAPTRSSVATRSATDDSKNDTLKYGSDTENLSNVKGLLRLPDSASVINQPQDTNSAEMSEAQKNGATESDNEVGDPAGGEEPQEEKNDNEEENDEGSSEDEELSRVDFPKSTNRINGNKLGETGIDNINVDYKENKNNTNSPSEGNVNKTKQTKTTSKSSQNNRKGSSSTISITVTLNTTGSSSDSGGTKTTTTKNTKTVKTKKILLKNDDRNGSGDEENEEGSGEDAKDIESALENDSSGDGMDKDNNSNNNNNADKQQETKNNQQQTQPQNDETQGDEPTGIKSNGDQANSNNIQQPSQTANSKNQYKEHTEHKSNGLQLKANNQQKQMTTGENHPTTNNNNDTESAINSNTPQSTKNAKTSVKGGNTVTINLQTSKLQKHIGKTNTNTLNHENEEEVNIKDGKGNIETEHEEGEQFPKIAHRPIFYYHHKDNSDTRNSAQQNPKQSFDYSLAYPINENTPNYPTAASINNTKTSYKDGNTKFSSKMDGSNNISEESGDESSENDEKGDEEIAFSTNNMKTNVGTWMQIGSQNEQRIRAKSSQLDDEDDIDESDEGFEAEEEYGKENTQNINNKNKAKNLQQNNAIPIHSGGSTQIQYQQKSESNSPKQTSAVQSHLITQQIGTNQAVSTVEKQTTNGIGITKFNGPQVNEKIKSSENEEGNNVDDTMQESGEQEPVDNSDDQDSDDQESDQDTNREAGNNPQQKIEKTGKDFRQQQQKTVQNFQKGLQNTVKNYQHGQQKVVQNFNQGLQKMVNIFQKDQTKTVQNLQQGLQKTANNFQDKQLKNVLDYQHAQKKIQSKQLQNPQKYNEDDKEDDEGSTDEGSTDNEKDDDEKQKSYQQSKTKESNEKTSLHSYQAKQYTQQLLNKNKALNSEATLLSSNYQETEKNSQLSSQNNVPKDNNNYIVDNQNSVINQSPTPIKNVSSDVQQSKTAERFKQTYKNIAPPQTSNEGKAGKTYTNTVKTSVLPFSKKESKNKDSDKMVSSNIKNAATDEGEFGDNDDDDDDIDDNDAETLNSEPNKLGNKHKYAHWKAAKLHGLKQSDIVDFMLHKPANNNNNNNKSNHNIYNLPPGGLGKPKYYNNSKKKHEQARRNWNEVKQGSNANKNDGKQNIRNETEESKEAKNTLKNIMKLQKDIEDDNTKRSNNWNKNNHLTSTSNVRTKKMEDRNQHSIAVSRNQIRKFKTQVGNTKEIIRYDSNKDTGIDKEKTFDLMASYTKTVKQHVDAKQQGSGKSSIGENSVIFGDARENFKESISSLKSDQVGIDYSNKEESDNFVATINGNNPKGKKIIKFNLKHNPSNNKEKEKSESISVYNMDAGINGNINQSFNKIKAHAKKGKRPTTDTKLMKNLQYNNRKPEKAKESMLSTFEPAASTDKNKNTNEPETPSDEVKKAHDEDLMKTANSKSTEESLKYLTSSVSKIHAALSNVGDKGRENTEDTREFGSSFSKINNADTKSDSADNESKSDENDDEEEEKIVDQILQKHTTGEKESPSTNRQKNSSNVIRDKPTYKVLGAENKENNPVMKSENKPVVNSNNNPIVPENSTMEKRKTRIMFTRDDSISSTVNKVNDLNKLITSLAPHIRNSVNDTEPMKFINKTDDDELREFGEALQTIVESNVKRDTTRFTPHSFQHGDEKNVKNYFLQPESEPESRERQKKSDIEHLSDSDRLFQEIEESFKTVGPVNEELLNGVENANHQVETHHDDFENAFDDDYLPYTASMRRSTIPTTSRNKTLVTNKNSSESKHDALEGEKKSILPAFTSKKNEVITIKNNVTSYKSGFNKETDENINKNEVITKNEKRGKENNKDSINPIDLGNHVITSKKSSLLNKYDMSTEKLFNFLIQDKTSDHLKVSKRDKDQSVVKTPINFNKTQKAEKKSDVSSQLASDDEFDDNEFMQAPGYENDEVLEDAENKMNEVNHPIYETQHTENHKDINDIDSYSPDDRGASKKDERAYDKTTLSNVIGMPYMEGNEFDTTGDDTAKEMDHWEDFETGVRYSPESPMDSFYGPKIGEELEPMETNLMSNGKNLATNTEKDNRVFGDTNNKKPTDFQKTLQQKLYNTKQASTLKDANLKKQGENESGIQNKSRTGEKNSQGKQVDKQIETDNVKQNTKHDNTNLQLKSTTKSAAITNMKNITDSKPVKGEPIKNSSSYDSPLSMFEDTVKSAYNGNNQENDVNLGGSISHHNGGEVLKSLVFDSVDSKEKESLDEDDTLDEDELETSKLVNAVSETKSNSSLFTYNNKDQPINRTKERKDEIVITNKKSNKEEHINKNSNSTANTYKIGMNTKLNHNDTVTDKNNEISLKLTSKSFPEKINNKDTFQIGQQRIGKGKKYIKKSERKSKGDINAKFSKYLNNIINTEYTSGKKIGNSFFNRLSKAYNLIFPEKEESPGTEKLTTFGTDNMYTNQIYRQYPEYNSFNSGNFGYFVQNPQQQNTEAKMQYKLNTLKKKRLNDQIKGKPNYAKNHANLQSKVGKKKELQKEKSNANHNHIYKEKLQTQSFQQTNPKHPHPMGGHRYGHEPYENTHALSNHDFHSSYGHQGLHDQVADNHDNNDKFAEITPNIHGNGPKPSHQPQESDNRNKKLEQHHQQPLDQKENNAKQKYHIYPFSRSQHQKKRPIATRRRKLHSQRQGRRQSFRHHQLRGQGHAFSKSHRMKNVNVRKKIHNQQIPNVTQSDSQMTCQRGLTLRGATLRGGIMAGDFTSKGVVDTQKSCVEMCCQSKKCDIAMTIGRECINIKCYNRKNCNVAPAGSIAARGGVLPITTFVQKVDPNAISRRDEIPRPFTVFDIMKQLDDSEFEEISDLIKQVNGVIE